MVHEHIKLEEVNSYQDGSRLASLNRVKHSRDPSVHISLCYSVYLHELSPELNIHQRNVARTRM